MKNIAISTIGGTSSHIIIVLVQYDSDIIVLNNVHSTIKSLLFDVFFGGGPWYVLRVI
jgi:hypothetical protein